MSSDGSTQRKTALVTGGTSGVGLSMVRALVDAGTFVHFIGRRESKGRSVLQLANNYSLTRAGTNSVHAKTRHDGDPLRALRRRRHREQAYKDRLLSATEELVATALEASPP